MFLPFDELAVIVPHRTSFLKVPKAGVSGRDSNTIHEITGKVTNKTGLRPAQSISVKTTGNLVFAAAHEIGDATPSKVLECADYAVGRHPS